MKDLFREKNKKNIILLIIIPLVVFIIIGFIVSQENSKDQVTKKQQPRGDNLANIDRIGGEEITKGDNKTKIDIYEQMERRLLREERKDEEIDEGDFFVIGTGSPEKNNDREKQKEDKATGQKNVKTKSRSTQRSQPSVARTSGNKMEKSEVKQEQGRQERKNHSRLSVLGRENKTSTNEKSERENFDVQKEFIPGFLEEEQTVKRNESVIFLLEKDIEIDGVNFRRHSIMYGITTTSRDRIYVNIRRIKNYNDGKMYEVHLVGFNEDYIEGILPTNLDEKRQEASSDAMAEGAREIGGETMVGRIASGMARSTSRAGKRGLKADLNEGYRMFFINKKN